ncbi:MAG TPA: phosphatidate cytidylyltransferase [Myxococcales bacterium]|jgi:phosphatidate cytidylyltransferase|nr:phosphatidate cytidylyltransferase [Myxococcales bacterium]
MNEKNRNLAVRVATALLLLPLVLRLLWLGGLPFTLLLSWAAGAAALELNLFARNDRPGPAAAPGTALPFGNAGALTGSCIASVVAAFLLPLLTYASVPFVSAKSVLALLVVVAFTDALFFETDLARVPSRVGMAILGAVYPGLLISALVRLRELPSGASWILLALVVTWFNDTGAYFAGRAFGRRKLYPRISPSKTVEGAAGGFVASVGGAVAVKLLFLPQLPWWCAAIIGAGGALLGPLGDLSESMLKRAYGAKDSGNMLPGHGGLLDRIDALLFNAPFVLFCARLFAP